MALTCADVEMWNDLKGLIHDSPRILEIGQANWFGDIRPPDGCEDECSFQVARNFYKKILGYSSIVSVDLHGQDSYRWDLNEPLPMDGIFDVVINTGTAEHVFDQRQLMETVHDYCDVGGLMVHAAPFEGWTDHGFYCYQPTFFRDLAVTNGYEMVYFVKWQTGPDSMLYVAMRKTDSAPFMVPRQGKYREAFETRGSLCPLP